MLTQPNPRHEIMVTFKMDPSIARAEATICICFVDGVMFDHHVSLDNLEIGLESRLGGTSTSERWSGGANVLKGQVGVMRSFRGSQKPRFSSLRISR